MTHPEFKVLIVGLDGATFDLMLPWIEEGRLPCLQQLLESGAHSRLESTLPPITPCAWSSFMTGKNPGKHGLFDFVEPDPANPRQFRFTNASCRHGESLWGILSRQQRKVGVVNVPMTYPPEQVDGYLISGLDTPHEHSPFMHPGSIGKELKNEGIKYSIDLQHLGNMRTDARREATLQQIFAAEEARTDALRLLSQRYPADFRMIVYGATDQVQHHFWHYMDSSHDKHDAAGAANFQHAIRDTYEMVDRQMARLLEDCGDDTIVIVMSDHGFGPMTNVRIRLNQVLEDAGLLTFIQERSAGRVKRALASTVDRVLRSTLSSHMKRTIAGMFPRLRDWFERLDDASVDWDRTQAYVNEAYRSSPAVWINSQEGDAEADNEQKLLEQVEQLLQLLVDPQTGQPLISELVRTADVYHGPYADQGPDLLLSWWKDGFLLEQSEPGGPADRQVERSTEPIQGGVEFAASHRMDGVFMISGGPALENLEFDGARIIDVAPTVLHLMGHPVPSDMDGRVLDECLDPQFMAEHPVAFEQSDDSDTAAPAAAKGDGFTEDESEMIRKRLQALGYIK